MKRSICILPILFSTILFSQEHTVINTSEILEKLAIQVGKSIKDMNEETKKNGSPKKDHDVTVYVSDKHPVAGTEDHRSEEERSIVTNLLRLTEGNKRFVSGTLTRKELASQRRGTVNGQSPFAIVVTCSDSRVPPEMIFDESIGQLFVIRLAGNVVDSLSLGSVEYAVEHLHAHTLVILGHHSCGAVKAALQGGHLPPNIASIIRRIDPAVAKAKERNPDGNELLNESIKENVHEQIRRSMSGSTILHDAMMKGELLVLGGIYDLATGKVKFLTGE